MSARGVVTKNFLNNIFRNFRSCSIQRWKPLSDTRPRYGVIGGQTWPWEPGTSDLWASLTAYMLRTRAPHGQLAIPVDSQGPGLSFLFDRWPPLSRHPEIHASKPPKMSARGVGTKNYLNNIFRNFRSCSIQRWKPLSDTRLRYGVIGGQTWPWEPGTSDLWASLAAYISRTRAPHGQLAIPVDSQGPGLSFLFDRWPPLSRHPEIHAFKPPKMSARGLGTKNFLNNIFRNFRSCSIQRWKRLSDTRLRYGVIGGQTWPWEFGTNDLWASLTAYISRTRAPHGQVTVLHPCSGDRSFQPLCEISSMRDIFVLLLRMRSCAIRAESKYSLRILVQLVETNLMRCVSSLGDASFPRYCRFTSAHAHLPNSSPIYAQLTD